MTKTICIPGWPRVKDRDIAPICTDLGFEVRVPGGFWPPHTKETPEQYFALLLKCLEDADLVVVALVPDRLAETALSIGYAMARGKTVIALQLNKHLRYHLIEQCAYMVEDLDELRRVLAALRPPQEKGTRE